jgi:hypothetical protein
MQSNYPVDEELQKILYTLTPHLPKSDRKAADYPPLHYACYIGLRNLVRCLIHISFAPRSFLLVLSSSFSHPRSLILVLSSSFFTTFHLSYLSQSLSFFICYFYFLHKSKYQLPRSGKHSQMQPNTNPVRNSGRAHRCGEIVD